MATETQETANRTASPAQSPGTDWMHSPDSLLNYCEDLSRLYTQALEQGLRLMTPQMSPVSANEGAYADGLSELIKAMERSQELLFTQLESVTAFQSAFWEPWLKQLGGGPTNRGTADKRRKSGPSA